MRQLGALGSADAMFNYSGSGTPFELVTLATATRWNPHVSIARCPQCCPEESRSGLLPSFISGRRSMLKLLRDWHDFDKFSSNVPGQASQGWLAP